MTPKSFIRSISVLLVLILLVLSYRKGERDEAAACRARVDEAVIAALEADREKRSEADRVAGERESDRQQLETATAAARLALKGVKRDACTHTDAGDDVLRLLDAAEAS